MSDTRYPTRMHEVLGVETGERFRLKNEPYGNEWFVSEFGMMIMDYEDGVARSGVHSVFSAINNGIIRKPRLTEEQVKQLQALVTLGFRWLIKNNDCSAYAYTYMPEKMDAWWEGVNADVQIFIDLPTGVLYDLVSWSDPEPLDIVATLKAAGVEVEG